MACAGTPRGPKAALTRFPIGIYGGNDPKHLARLKSDGFDSFHCSWKDFDRLAAMAKEAKHQGMRMIISPDEIRRKASSHIQEWPVDAWYLFDEPDVHRLSSATLQGISEQTRSWDPERPQTFVIGQGSPTNVYGRIGDILMMDWYPVPHRAPDSVADQIDLLMKTLPKGKPFWMVIQAYDWADEIKDPTKIKGLRFPNRHEIRFMSYIAVMHGARGLFYCTLLKKGKTLFEYPELWQEVSVVTREIRDMRPVFERGKRVRLPFPPNPDGVEAKAWRYKNRDHVIILNRKATVYQKVPEELFNGLWQPIHCAKNNCREALSSFYGAWYLRPYHVMVFKSRLNWFRGLSRGLPIATSCDQDDTLTRSRHLVK